MKKYLEHILERKDLSEAQSAKLLEEITATSDAPVLIGAILSALSLKGETAAEIRGFARTMSHLALRTDIDPDLLTVDIVGTGGDGSNSINLSTGAALLTAACGQPVVKHGNRAVSSRSGSADVMEALGIRLPRDKIEAGRLLDATGFTFLFAPFFHPAMKRVAEVRRALGVRTIFNLLGPLTNPAAPPFGVIGAYSLSVARLLADALAGMSRRRVFVVHGAEHWDEPTPVGPFTLLDVTQGQVTEKTVDPRDLGLPRCEPVDLKGGAASENAHRLTQVFCGQRGPLHDALILSAALALEVSAAVPDTMAGIERATQVLEEGTCANFVQQIVTASGGKFVAVGRQYG